MKKTTFFSIAFIFCLQFIFAQINNEGILKINSGTLVYFGDVYTNEAGAVHYNNGNLHINNNFVNDGVTADGTFTPTAGTTFFDNISSTYTTPVTNTIQVLSGTTNRAVFYNVEVANHVASQGLQVGTTASATTDDFELQVVNGVNLAAGDLRLMGDAQLVQTHSGAYANAGTGHLLKDQDGAANSYRYNYWSSPVQSDAGGTYEVNNTANTVLKDGITPNSWTPGTIAFTTALNGTDAPKALSTRWIWKYVNNTIDPYNDTNWTSLFNLQTTTPSAGTAVKPGEGFLIKGTNSAASLTTTYNYTFEGKPNDGDYSLVIAANNEYLVGNPYPSAIDAHQFIDDNAGILNGTLYYWDDWTTTTHVYNQYSAGYIEYTKLTQLGPTLHDDFVGTTVGPIANPSPQAVGRYIPVGQGFIVRSVVAPSTTNVVFNNGQRTYVKEGVTSVFTRSSGNRVTNVNNPLIRIGYEQPSGRHRYTVLGFTNETTDSYDYGWDGVANDIAPNDMFYTIANDTRSFVIQAGAAFNIDAQYPITVKIQEAGVHKIMIDALENFTGDVFVFDAVTGLSTKINNTSFDINLPAGTYANRFSIVFKPANVLAVDDEIVSDLQVYYNGNENEIVIDKLNQLEISDIKIYNAIGQLITSVQKNLEGQQTINIPFKVAQGVYIVQINSNKGKGSFKIIND